MKFLQFYVIKFKLVIHDKFVKINNFIGKIIELQYLCDSCNIMSKKCDLVSVYLKYV